ncbi:DUF1156 domain-containing protein [Microbispora sp. NPDC046973]|uniref:DUF1156 domain-containing protein n=1 Tax=Microbispora sp. NPDC046973 TaxID=3155022 RepID=UPI003401D17C
MSQGPSGKYRRKLIDVTLPLTQISTANVAEKNRKVGTVKNFHKWFAPMPTPGLRALIFASLVDDPGPGPERDALIEVVKELVPPTGVAPSDGVLRKALKLIAKSNPTLPTVMDPFAGGGSTIVEALRLGLPAVSSDLNPVAALVTRALGELLPTVALTPAISKSNDAGRMRDLPYDGFADDLRHYGALVQEAVQANVGHLYPVLSEGEPVAWLWARTALCPNPMCDVRVPLFGSPWLSKQKGREATVEAVVEGSEVRFVVHQGKNSPAKATKGSGRAQFACPKCSTPLGEKELRAAGKADELGLQLMAYCMDTKSGRTFVTPSSGLLPDSDLELPDDLDDIELIGKAAFNLGGYGFKSFLEIYTPRQLIVLKAFSDEVAAIYDRIVEDGGSSEQARAISTILGICVSKMAQANSTLVRWFIDPRNGAPKAVQAFGTQAMPMLWDFAETYPFGKSVGSWTAQISSIVGLLKILPISVTPGRVAQIDARRAGELVDPGTALIVTDPPYFGQINYADLSDYFYLWLRRALRGVHPDFFGTIATPKAVELVANPGRHGGKEAAKQYFIDGFTEVFTSLQKASHPDLPIVVAYAAKQDDAEGKGAVSSAWVAMLQAVLASGLAVVGTLPIESTMSTRQIGLGSNALASYIILICRPRQAEDIADKSTFLSRLQEELPEAIEALRKGGVSPLDMGQAAIGPGMRIFSGYREVLQPDGAPMTVREALIEIDKAATAIIDGEEAEYDAPTRFALKWFRQFAFDRGDFGDADVVLRQTGTGIRDLVEAGIVSNTPRSKVCLLDFDELPANYDPAKDERISHWEVAMHLAKRFNEQGIDGAARLVAGARSRRDAAISMDRVNRLVHRLFKISDRRFQKTAAMFNQLGTAWPDIMERAQTVTPDRYVTDEIDGLFSTTNEGASGDDD